MPLARGKYAFGFCDKTGFRYNLNELVDEVKNGVKTGLKVGRDVSDPDHPQNFLGRLRIHDPQSLANARPDRFSDSVTVTFPTFDVSTLTQVNVGFGVGRAGNLTTTGAPVQSQNTSLQLSAVFGVGAVGSMSVSTGSATTYTVTVASGTNSYGSGNKYYIAGLSGASPTLTLNEGQTYRFDQSDSSNSGHPFRFSTTANGTHGGGSQYTTGVTVNGTAGNAGAYVEITVASGAPTLYYYCTNHSGMGGQANTP